MDHKETVKSGYNKIAEQYLAERRHDSEDVRLLADFMELLAKDALVLDAGCGAGIPVAQKLAERFNVIGVDFSEAQVELAKKNVPNAKFLCQDMTQLMLPENMFDGIVSYYAIIHIPREEHQLLLTNFHKFLKHGGIALLCLGAENLIDDIDENFLGTRMYWSHFDSETYRDLLKECGFSIIWAKHVADSLGDGAHHLFVLVQKAQA